MKSRTQAAFVARDEELQQLETLLEQVTPSVVVVTGPAGIGKSTLLLRFIERNPEATRFAPAAEEERHVTFAVLDHLLPRSLRTGLAAVDAFAAGSVLLDHLAELQEGGRGVALVVDDADAADAASFRALLFALRRSPRDALVLVLGVRDTQAHGVLDAVRRLPVPSHTITLSGLSVNALMSLAEALTGERLPRAAAERLHAHTGGNPLYATALLREHGAGRLTLPGTPLPAPQAYASHVAEVLRTCDEDGRRFALAVAVLGGRSPLADAAALAEVGDPLRAVDAGVAAGLLRTQGTPPVAVFEHAIARAAVLEAAPRAELSALHRRAADSLPEEQALAHLVAAADRPDDSLVGRVVASAAAQAQAGDPTGAAHRLLGVLDMAESPASRQRLLLEAVQLLLIAGEVPDAAALASEIAALPPSARRDHALGQLSLFSGRADEAERLLEAAWQARVPGEDDDLAAPIALALAQLDVVLARGEGAATWARRGLDQPGTPPPLVERLVTRIGIGLGMAGRITEALESLGDPGPGEALGLHGRGILRLWDGDLDGAIDDLSRAGDVLPVASPDRLAGLGYLAEAQFRRGSWDDAVRDADLARSLVRDSDQGWLTAFVAAVAAAPLTARADPEAQSAVAEATAAAAVTGDPASALYAAAAASRLALQRSREDEVLARLEPFLAVQGDGIDEPGIVVWRDLLARAHLARGDLDRADEVLAPLERRARERGSSWGIGLASLVRAAMLEACGERPAAEATVRAALEAVAPTGALPLEASLRASLGGTLRRAGRRRAAGEELDQARATFLALGAVSQLEECEREMAACGLAPAPRGGDRRRSLTAQELAVAGLAADGLTNREVAHRLVVSVKTVEYHLRNAFDKLGIRSRGDLDRALAGSRAD